MVSQITSTSKRLSSSVRLFDIAANLCDDKFKGIYNGKTYHEPDFDEVVKRASNFQVKKMLFASGSLNDSHENFKLSSKSENYYMTIGTHPCHASVYFI